MVSWVSVPEGQTFKHVLFGYKYLYAVPVSFKCCVRMEVILSFEK